MFLLLETDLLRKKDLWRTRLFLREDRWETQTAHGKDPLEEIAILGRARTMRFFRAAAHSPVPIERNIHSLLDGKVSFVSLAGVGKVSHSMPDSELIDSLRSRFNAGENLKYVFFWGHQPGKSRVTSSCFSQWYEAPFEVDGKLYPTAEHFMMAEKAALFGDDETRGKVLLASNPGAAKALGRRVQVIWPRKTGQV